MGGKIIWQPNYLHAILTGFEVCLDKEFGQKMLSKRITHEAKRSINELGVIVLKQRRFDWPEPFLFYEDTALVKTFYIGRNGKSLDLEMVQGILPDFKRNLVYLTHNCDNALDRDCLLSLMDLWVSYSGILLES